MDELPDLSTLSHEQMGDLTRLLFGMVQKLTLRVAELEARLAMNSHNSSKPPSLDGLNKPPPKPKSLRVSGVRKTGGQQGHAGKTLLRSDEPDHVVTHRPPSHCTICQQELPAGKVVESRQVFELPQTRYEVTEYQCVETRCTCGAVFRGKFPQGVDSSVQYGPRALAAVVTLTQHQMLPLQRTAQLMHDLFQLPMSEAVIIKACREASKRLEPTVKLIGEAILKSPVAHADETGFRVAAKLHWIHCFASNHLTWLACHAKRGQEAFKEFRLLSRYRGTLVHDGWASYRELKCQHALCNAHHIRELVYLVEEMQQTWAGQMIELLRTACHAKNEAQGKALTVLQTTQFRERYEQILSAGERAYPPQPSEGKPGRVRQSKATNLLARLRLHADDVWRFATQPEVPFTNNIAELAVRMPKVKQKVSGGLRTLIGAKNFCTIRSYLATMQQQGHSLFLALSQVFQSNVPQPCFD